MRPERRRFAYMRFGVGVAIVALVLLLVSSGILEPISGRGLREVILQAGLWGPIAFVAVFALLQPFGFSAHILVVTASLIWPVPTAIALSLVGALLSTSVSFGFARYVGRDWVQERLPERLKPYDRRLQEGGIRAVITLRLFFYTFPPLQFLFGISRLRLPVVLAGSAIGLLPTMVTEVLLGATIYEWLVG